MQEAALSPLVTWTNFYVIIGTAAATLTGLMFVVVTLVSGVRTRGLLHDGFEVFNTPTVVHFCAALLVAVLLSAPWQALFPAGLLLGLVGLAGVGYVLFVFRRILRQKDYHPVLEDWLWHTIFPLASYTALLVAGILLPTNPVPALFVIGAAIMLLLFIGIHNAWDNVTYLTFSFSGRENTPEEQ